MEGDECPNGHGVLSSAYGHIETDNSYFKVYVWYCEECGFIGEADANW